MNGQWKVLLLCVILIASSCIVLTSGARASGTEAWGEPLVLQEGVVRPGATAPRVAMNDDGDIITAWVSGDGTSSQVNARLFSDGAWGEVTTISSMPTQANYVEVEMNDDGDAVIVWQQTVSPGYVIYACTYIDGTWGTARPVSPEGGRAFMPQAIIDSDKKAIITWLQDEQEWSYIYASVLSGEVLEGPTRISLDPGRALSPQIVADGDGGAMIVWSQRQGMRVTIDSVTYSDGTWSDIRTFSDAMIDCFGCHVALDGAGNGIMAWNQNNGAAYSLVAVICTDGSWGTPQKIAVAVDGGADPEVAIGPGGDAVVAWKQFVNDYSVIRALTWSDGAWGTTSVISDPARHSLPCQVAMDDAGNTIAVWSQSGPSGSAIVANTYAGGAWKGYETISLPDQDCYESALAMNGAGYAIAVWQAREDFTSIGSIYASVYDPSTRPSVVIISPSEGEFFNGSDVTVSWIGHRASHYTVSLNGTVISSGTSTVLSLPDLQDGYHSIVVTAHNSEGETSSDQLRFTVDTIAPVSTIIPNGSGVAVSTKVTVTFSEPMDRDSVSIVVEGVSGTILWNGNDAIFTPSGPLAYYTTYKVSVSGSDLAGNFMASEVEFTTTRNECSIIGTVRDANGNAIAGAVVELDNGMTATTDKDGCFEIAGIPSGPYVLSITKEGYRTSTLTINATAGVTTVLPGLSVSKNDAGLGGVEVWAVGIIGATVALVAAVLVLRHKKG